MATLKTLRINGRDVVLKQPLEVEVNQGCADWVSVWCASLGQGVVGRDEEHALKEFSSLMQSLWNELARAERGTLHVSAIVLVYRMRQYIPEDA